MAMPAQGSRCQHVTHVTIPQQNPQCKRSACQPAKEEVETTTQRGKGESAAACDDSARICGTRNKAPQKTWAVL